MSRSRSPGQFSGSGRHVLSSTTTTNADNSSVGPTDHYLLMNTGGSGTTTRTVTLPENAPVGTTYIVKDVGGAAGSANIAIARSGSDTIDGQTTQTINSNYGAVTLVSDGSNWFIV